VADHGQKIRELKYPKLVGSQLFNTLNITASELLVSFKRMKMDIIEKRLVILKLKIPLRN